MSSAFNPLIAGFTGGVVSTSLLLPLDVIKVRLQVHEGGRKRSLSALRVMGGIIKYEGVRGLWVGWTPAVVGSAISWGGYFYFYEGMKTKLANYRQTTTTSQQADRYELTPSDNFVLACSSGALMVLLTNPIWLIKTRMQLQMKKSSEIHNIKPYRNMVDAASTIIRDEGPLALYKGSGPALLLTSHGGVQFVVYEYMKKHFHFQREKREESHDRKSGSIWERLEKSMGYLAMGAVSKIVASTATYPLQTIKARMQQRSDTVELTSDGKIRAVRREYNGLLSTIRRMYQNEGALVFYRGCVPNAIRVAPGAAITFLVYEGVMDFLQP